MHYLYWSEKLLLGLMIFQRAYTKCRYRIPMYKYFCRSMQRRYVSNGHSIDVSQSWNVLEQETIMHLVHWTLVVKRTLTLLYFM